MVVEHKTEASARRALDFQITGMHCAGCAARVERAVSALPGVASAVVNLLQENLKVVFAPETVSPEQIMTTVRGLGFAAQPYAAPDPVPPAALEVTPAAPEGPPATRTFNVQVRGMHCAACAARVERAVSGLPGVVQAEVNLLAESLRVVFNPAQVTAQRIKDAVAGLGYGLEDETEDETKVAAAQTFFTDEPPEGPLARPREPDAFAAFLDRQNRQEARLAARQQSLRRELILAFSGVMPLLVISMGHMAGLPLPPPIDPLLSPAGFALLQLVLTLPAIWAGRDIFRLGTRQLMHLAPSMDSLVCLGAGAALVYSLWGTAVILMNPGAAHLGLDLYYESAAVVLTLVMLGRWLELRSRAKAGDALRALIRLAPATAVLVQNGGQREIPLAQVKVGDTLLVRPGESVPVDGVVIGGASTVDESMLSGESLPVDKGPGATLTGGALNQYGALTMRAEAVGADTVLARMARLVWEAQSSKAPISSLADRISLYFVPVVLALALMSGGLWYFAAGQDFAFALRIAIAVLVVACPCAMGLATPTSIMVGTGVGARLGVLVRGGAALEAAGRVDTVVLDKTGTLTRNEVAVLAQKIFPPATAMPLPGGGKMELHGEEAVEDFLGRVCLALAGAVGALSTHPLSAAMAKAAAQRGLPGYELENFVSLTGQGVKATYGDAKGEPVPVALGNLEFMAELAQAAPAALGEGDLELLRQQAAQVAQQGATPLFLAVNFRPVAMFSLAAPLRPEAGAVVAAFKDMGLRIMLLSGDAQATADSVARSVGIAEVLAEVRPEDKERVVAGLTAQGLNVAMVGDGINDAPALAAAKVGLAMGGGAQAAMEAADIVLLREDLGGALTAIALGRATLRNIRQNLAWAFGYNILCLPVAAGVLHIFGGPTLSPMLAGAAMAFSSVSVVSNALRLRKFTHPLEREEVKACSL